MTQTVARIALRAAQLALAALAAAYLIYFADHGRQLLAFPYPLDYGEGPLQAQVDRLRAGVPVWELYGDPSAPPFLIVNYPPLYLLLSAALAPLAGSTLVAGRLVSLLAALGCAAAIAVLARPGRGRSPWPAALAALLFLSVPIVREWSALMRVDMLGVCLGLWGLVALTWRERLSPARGALAGLLLLACLFAKPSLLAAPLAAGGWLLWRLYRARGQERRAVLAAALALGATAALGGGLLFALLQWASGGWFALHVVAANANRWDAALAQGFWRQQLALRWPLGAAAALAAALAWPAGAAALVLPGLYTLGGAAVAAGVGKVGAYSNYFLELYAGLVWLVAIGVGRGLAAGAAGDRPRPLAGAALQGALAALLIASLLRYPPLWDPTWLRPAGLIAPSPPRLALGRYGLWADAARERKLLAAQARVGAALAAEVAAAGPRVFTDMPGVASAAGVESRLQAFEARQLFDQGLAAEDGLLLELANGQPPLAVIDYLGNWLPPGAVEILQRRYAHDGSLGTFDLYRPVDAGPSRPAGHSFATAGGPLELASFRLPPPLGAAYEPGELLALALAWRRGDAAPPDDLSVVVQITTAAGDPLLESERPLLYGALPPARWPAGAPVEHMQPLALPPDLPAGRYALAVGLRSGGADLGPPQVIASLDVAPEGGMAAESGQFVPARLAQAWAELGGAERAGLPLTPAVPFAWGRLQCFERLCLELRGDAVRQRPLGATLYLAETIRGDGCPAGAPGEQGLCPGFAEAPLAYAELGPAISGELERNGWVVQWTEHARLERAPEGGPPALGRLGDEILRLSPGARYRWP
jgi:hypothetical protein